MTWSKIRKMVRSLIHPELRNRVDLHCTTYRSAHDLAGEEWITVDGERVFFGGCCHWHSALPTELNEVEPWLWSREGFTALKCDCEIVQEIQEQEVSGVNHIRGSLMNYLNAPILESLDATNPIVRAFSIVDRRVGTRRLKCMVISESDHSLVRRFYTLRMELLEQRKGRKNNGAQSKSPGLLSPHERQRRGDRAE